MSFSTSLANVAIPTLVPHILLAALLLAPVVYVESLFLRPFVRTPSSALEASFLANLRSTLIGLPIGWAFALAGIIPLGTILGDRPESELLQATLLHTLVIGGTIPSFYSDFGLAAGTALILIPYFVASVVIEHHYLRRHLKHLAPKAIWQICIRMNGATYTVLGAWATLNIVHTTAS